MKKALIIILSIFFGLLAAVYAAGIIFGFFGFYPNTFINGTDVSWMKPEDAQEQILPREREFTVLRNDGTSETIQLDTVDLKAQTEQPVAHLLRLQKQMAWPACFFKNTEFENGVVLSYDEGKLDRQIAELEVFDEDLIRAPENAYIAADSEGHYSIIPEDNGNTPIPEKVRTSIKEALNGVQFEADLAAEDCYIKAEITENDPELTDKMALIETLHEEVITIDLTDAEEVLTTLDLCEMTSLNEEGIVVVDWDMLDEYIDELAEKYETYMQKRKFKTTGGKVIETGGSQSNGIATDTYGFLMDKVQTFNAIYYAIYAQESQTIEAVWQVPALTRGQENGDIGKTYIEISKEQQHLWYYVDGKLAMETDVVTGMPTPARETPTGLFRIFGWLKDTNLIGEMEGESWNSHVDYWLSVTWDAVGIHDAPWRNAFGGQIYKTNGSHGCINLPHDKEEWLFYNVEMDTPVIIY